MSRSTALCFIVLYVAQNAAGSGDREAGGNECEDKDSLSPKQMNEQALEREKILEKRNEMEMERAKGGEGDCGILCAVWFAIGILFFGVLVGAIYGIIVHRRERFKAERNANFSKWLDDQAEKTGMNLNYHAELGESTSGQNNNNEAASTDESSDDQVLDDDNDVDNNNNYYSEWMIAKIRRKSEDVAVAVKSLTKDLARRCTSGWKGAVSMWNRLKSRESSSETSEPSEESSSSSNRDDAKRLSSSGLSDEDFEWDYYDALGKEEN